jgi:sulfur carrier protein ThiS adenylyltransferase
MNEQLTERYSRQQDIVPAERIAACKATIVGVGAIGRQVALQLAAMGIPWLQLIDFDIVEPSNLASQGYLENDLSHPKVEATGNICRQINGSLELHQLNDRFKRGMAVGNTVFCCVDKIDIRKLVWQAVKDRINFFCDGRMSAEVIRVITACDYESQKYYPTTLFAPQEAYTGPCTARTTIYSANIAAGVMLAQFSRYLRQFPIDCDIQLNLLTTELTLSGGR